LATPNYGFEKRQKEQAKKKKKEEKLRAKAERKSADIDASNNGAPGIAQDFSDSQASGNSRGSENPQENAPLA